MGKVFPGFQPSPLRDYVALLAAERRLSEAGYGKVHYVHYALPPDQYTYYRHATRGEDLLAIGASASGCVGPWTYQSAEYPGYLERAGNTLPVVSVANEIGSSLQTAIEARLMASSLPLPLAEEGLPAALLARWLHAGLLRQEEEALQLSAAGSWLIGPMLDELRSSVASI